MIETISFVFLYSCFRLDCLHGTGATTIVLNSLDDISSALSRYTHKTDECDEFVGVIGQISTTLQLETSSLAFV